MPDKKPYLFYWEDSVDAWIPSNHDDLVDVESLEPDEVVKIQFKRCDMTEEEFNNLKEC